MSQPQTLSSASFQNSDGPHCSDGPAPPSGREERRGDERLITVLRVGKIVTGGQQDLCLIRNISANGLMANVRSGHRVGDRIEVELKSDSQLAGEVIWVKGQNIGVRFDGTIEVGDFLAHRPADDGRKPRPPRVEVSGRARIKADSMMCPAELRDISQGGVKIALTEQLEANGDVVVAIEGLDARKGVVRWYRDGQAGISFLRPIPFESLTQWLYAR